MEWAVEAVAAWVVAVAAAVWAEAWAVVKTGCVHSHTHHLCGILPFRRKRETFVSRFLFSDIKESLIKS